MYNLYPHRIIKIEEGYLIVHKKTTRHIMKNHIHNPAS